MKIIDEELLDILLVQLRTAPISQIDKQIKEELLKFTLEEPTKREKYDFLVKISEKDEMQISNFVKELCSLDKYYIRP